MMEPLTLSPAKNPPPSPLLLLLRLSLIVAHVCVLVSSSSSRESEPGDGECVGGGGRDGDDQLSGEEQRRLRHPAAQPQQTDHLLQRHETWVAFVCLLSPLLSAAQTGGRRTLSRSNLRSSPPAGNWWGWGGSVMQKIRSMLMMPAAMLSWEPAVFNVPPTFRPKIPTSDGCFTQIPTSKTNRRHHQ